MGAPRESGPLAYEGSLGQLGSNPGYQKAGNPWTGSKARHPSRLPWRTHPSIHSSLPGQPIKISCSAWGYSPQVPVLGLYGIAGTSLKNLLRHRCHNDD